MRGRLSRQSSRSGINRVAGLTVTASGLSNVHRELLIALAARHRLPAVYFNPVFASSGGLICYGPDAIHPHRRAAAYLDRILRGESPADLPVQAPTRYTLHVNLKTAKAQGFIVPHTLLARADEVIESGASSLQGLAARRRGRLRRGRSSPRCRSLAISMLVHPKRTLT